MARCLERQFLSYFHLLMLILLVYMTPLLIHSSTGNAYGQQTRNCELGGGVAALIYNDVDGPLDANVESGFNVAIPVIGISKADGENLHGRFGQTVKFETRDGYGKVSGTSFAAPFVSGAATRVWQACPKCSNVQVIDCLESSALDLGDRGYDEFYGHGLVQVEAAYACLKDEQVCCGDQAEPEATSGSGGPALEDDFDCVRKLVIARTCLAGEMETMSADSCRSCINDPLPSLVGATCDAIAGEMCPSFDSCPCGPCRDEIVDYFTCSYKEDSDCDLDCGSSMFASAQSAEGPTSDNTVDGGSLRTATASATSGAFFLSCRSRNAAIALLVAVAASTAPICANLLS